MYLLYIKVLIIIHLRNSTIELLLCIRIYLRLPDGDACLCRGIILDLSGRCTPVSKIYQLLSEKKNFIEVKI